MNGRRSVGDICYGERPEFGKCQHSPADVQNSFFFPDRIQSALSV